jgi:hypothetical protein
MEGIPCSARQRQARTANGLSLDCEAVRQRARNGNCQIALSVVFRLERKWEEGDKGRETERCHLITTYIPKRGTQFSAATHPSHPASPPSHITHRINVNHRIIGFSSDVGQSGTISKSIHGHELARRHAVYVSHKQATFGIPVGRSL